MSVCQSLFQADHLGSPNGLSGDLYLNSKEAVQQSCCLSLRSRHQVPVQVERDLDRGMAHEGQEGLGVDPRRIMKEA